VAVRPGTHPRSHRTSSARNWVTWRCSSTSLAKDKLETASTRLRAGDLKLAEYDVSESHIDAAAVNLKAAGESLEAYEPGDGRRDRQRPGAGRVEVEEEIARWWKAIAKWLGPMD